MMKINPRPFTEKIKHRFDGNVFYFERFPRGYLYAYNKSKGIWEEVSAEVEKILRQTLSGDNLSLNAIRQVMGDLCQSLYRRDSPEEPSWNLINFENGVWDVKEGRFVTVQSGDEPPFFLSRIPHRFDPKGHADPGRIDRIFEDWVSAEYKILLYEIPGYALLRCQSAQKFFNLYGPGDNGKTTFVGLLQRVIGIDNCSSLSMDEIMSDRFALSSLRGKLVNITGELSPTLKRTDKMKLLTGGDLVFAQEKFKAGFSFMPYAKLIFMGNVVPSTPDSSPGFYRRTLIIPFLNTIPPEKRDPELLAKITEEEVHGLLKKVMLKILPAFVERRFKFSVDPSVDELSKKWEEFSNPLDNFIEDCFEPALEPGFLPNAALNPIYEDYCKRKGIPRLNTKEFSDQMRKKGFIPENRRLSESEMEKFKKMHPSLSSPCRGWWCNAVTLVTGDSPLKNNDLNNNIGVENGVTTDTALQTASLLSSEVQK